MALPRVSLPRTGRLVERLLVACMVLGFVALIVIGAAARQAFGRNAEHGAWVVHTYQVEGALSEALLLMERAENTRRGYMLTLTPMARRIYADTVAAVGPAMGRVAQLTADNPRQQRALADARRQVAVILADQAGTNALADAGRGDAALALFRTQATRRPFTPLRAILAGMQREERRLLAERDLDQQRGLRRFYRLLVAAGALIAGVALVSFLTVIRYTRDLDRSQASLRVLNETLEEQVAERTADLSRANDEIQRFAYIVSHDLRSPLVNVMGFTAELQAAVDPLSELVARAEAEAPAIVTEEARTAAREDLPESIAFIRTSTQKMDRLINAILKLSREGRRVITPEPLDLDALADGVAASLRHLVDDRGAIMGVDHPLPALVSDRVAVEQILSNLAENAVKYLQPGRPGRITIGGRAERGRVVLSVTDNGRGIQPSDHQRVFDLFRRSGAQDQPGEGIGLAHVRALAYRLGGVVDLQSEFGQGSTFSLNLPATFGLQDPV